jgi:hypothetical protein
MVETHWAKIPTIPLPRVSPGTCMYPKGLQEPKTNWDRYSHHNHHPMPPPPAMITEQMEGSPTLVEPLSLGPGRATGMALGHNPHVNITGTGTATKTMTIAPTNKYKRKRTESSERPPGNPTQQHKRQKPPTHIMVTRWRTPLPAAIER